MRISWLIPLFIHVVLTLVSAYAVVLPVAGIHPLSWLSVGFFSSVAGTVVTYIAGVLLVKRALGGTCAVRS